MENSRRLFELFQDQPVRYTETQKADRCATIENYRDPWIFYLIGQVLSIELTDLGT